MKLNRQKKQKNKGFSYIYGNHAVYAAISNPRRKHQKLFVNKNQKKNLSETITNLIPEVNELSNQEMYKMFGNEMNHQGIVLRTSPLNQPNLEDVIYSSNNKTSDIIVCLDQVTDPNNIGSIMRSCALFNCKTIIVSKDNAPNITPTLTKAASGALEVVNYISVVNLSRTIIQLKKNNYWIYGCESEKKNNNENLNLPKKCVIVFGSEGRGLRNLTKKECDILISIPIVKEEKYNIDSLNVSNACSIILYEHYKINK